MLNISTRVCVKHGGFLRFCLFPPLNALPSPFANDCYTHTFILQRENLPLRN